MSTSTDDVTLPMSRRPAAPSPHRGRRRERRRPPAGRVKALAVLAALVVVASAFLVPGVREQVRASYTRLPASYQELYFTRAPAVADGVVVVPVSLRDHSGGTHTYRLRVTLRTADGTVTATAGTTLTPRPDADAVLRLSPFRGPATVYVELLGHSQTLHFRLTQRLSDSKGNS